MDPGDHYSLLNGANIKVILPIAYGVPSLIFYLVVVFVLFRRLKSPFYRFFAIAGVTVIVTFILRRARFSPIFFRFYEALPEEGFVPSLVLSWWYHNNYSQMLATFFVTASRFTAVMLPFQNRKIWRVITPVGYILTRMLPLVVSYGIWAGGVYIRRDDDYWSGYRWDVTVLPFKTPRGLINGIVGILYGVPVTSMNVAIFYKLRVLGAHRRSNAEVKLLLLTSVITTYCVVNVAVYAMFYAAKTVLPTGTVAILFSVQSLVLDVHVLSAPWLLLLMSRAARHEDATHRDWLDQVYGFDPEHCAVCLAPLIAKDGSLRVPVQGVRLPNLP